jgi:hypothetical protein
MTGGQERQVCDFKSRLVGLYHLNRALNPYLNPHLSKLPRPIFPNVSEGANTNRNLDEDDPNESRYLGQNSIAAFLSEETRAREPTANGDQDVIRKDIMPILGLQISSAPYPFMSKEHMDKIRHDMAVALPSDRDVLK